MVKHRMIKHCVIIDLDGTIFDTKHRLHFLTDDPANKDWKSFFNACVDDVPNNYVVTLCKYIEMADEYANDHLLTDGPTIFLCSGRPDSHRNITVNMLAQYGVTYAQLLMRKAEDHRPDTIVKKEMLDFIRNDGWLVTFAVDDRPEVIEMYRENGVPCFVVEQEDWRDQIRRQALREAVDIIDRHVHLNTHTLYQHVFDAIDELRKLAGA